MERKETGDLLSNVEIPEKGMPQNNPGQPGFQTPHVKRNVAAVLRKRLPLEHGMVFGGCFKLERALGSGDEGGIWLAQDLRLDRWAVLKLLPEVICRDPGALSELKDVTRQSSELVHPHIARTYGYVESGEIDAIALEYVEGKTLTQLRLERPQQVFEVEELTTWLQSLFGVLDYAHAHTKLVHGGLRPDNLLVTAGGELMLTGFGLAGQIKKWLARLDPGSRSDDREPTAGSEPPGGEETTASNDVQGVGTTLYELLTGTVPYDDAGTSKSGKEGSNLCMAERRTERQVKGEEIPESWERAVAACLAKNPSQRPSSIRELAARLEVPVSPPG